MERKYFTWNMSLLASNHNLIDTKRGLDGEKVFYMEHVPAGLQLQFD